MNNCPKCGMGLSPEDTICSGCGEVIEGVDANYTFDYDALYSGEADVAQPETVAETPSVEEQSVVSISEEVEMPQPVVIEEPSNVVAEPEIEEPAPIEPATPGEEAIEPVPEVAVEIPDTVVEPQIEEPVIEQQPESIQDPLIIGEPMMMEASPIDNINVSLDSITGAPVDTMPQVPFAAPVAVEPVIGMPEAPMGIDPITGAPIDIAPQMPVMDTMPMPVDPLGGMPEVPMGIDPITGAPIDMAPQMPIMDTMSMPVDSLGGMPLMPEMQPVPIQDTGVVINEPPVTDLSSMLPPTLEAIVPVTDPLEPHAPSIASPFVPTLPNDLNTAIPGHVMPSLIPTQPGIIPTVKKEVSGSKLPMVIVIIVSLISIGIMIWFGSVILANNKKNDGNSGLQNSREYFYEGFRLYLPEGLVAEIVDGEFFVADKEKNWSAVISLQDGAYNTFVSNKSQVVSYYENFGYKAEEPKERDISGVRFVVMEVTMGSEKVLVAYAKASGTKMFGVIVKNEKQEYSDESLKEIGQLLATIRNDGTTNTLPEGFTIDMFKETFKVAE